MCKLKRLFFLTEVKCNSFRWGGWGVWWGGSTKLIAVTFGEEDILLRLFFYSSSLNSPANLMSLVSYGCSFFIFLCLPFMHLSNPMHQIQTLGWPHCLLKAHGLKPILVAPQPTKSILSSAFTCEISSAFLGCPCPLCVQTRQSPWHGSVTMPCWSFQTARNPSMSSSEKKCQPGSGLLEIPCGKEKVKAELSAGWLCSLNCRTVPTPIQQAPAVSRGSNNTSMSAWAHKLVSAPSPVC